MLILFFSSCCGVNMERVGYRGYNTPVDTEASFFEFTLKDPICIVAITIVCSQWMRKTFLLLEWHGFEQIRWHSC